MSDITIAIRAVVWDAIKKHYHFDAKEPRLLMYKEIFMDGNPIDKIALDIATVVEQAAEVAYSAAEAKIEAKAETKTETKTDKQEDDNYSYGYRSPYDDYGGEL